MIARRNHSTRPLYSERERLARELLPTLNAFVETFRGERDSGDALGRLVDMQEIVRFWASEEMEPIP